MQSKNYIDAWRFDVLGAAEETAYSDIKIMSTHSYLAETVVVKETQSFCNENGELPVMSSQIAGDVPPVMEQSSRTVERSGGACPFCCC